ncbi:DUF4397 domain-containing protein [Fonticella tunisiensis]|nr:DUF4397 domain-containing protein [Fonticella tunisiensis]
MRLLHASPDAPHIDAYLNDKLIASNLAFKGFTQYLPVTAGTYNIKIFPTGKRDNPVINTRLNIKARSSFTVAVGGKLSNINLYIIPEVPPKAIPGKVFIRFAHLSPDTPNVDITLPDGTRLFKNVEFKEYTKYIAVDEGTYTLQARPSGSNKPLLHVPNIRLKPNRYYTIYAVGFTGGNPPLQALIALDGISYLKL